MANKKKPKSFFEMTAAERDESVKEFDRESLFEESRPLSPKGKILWELAKRPATGEWPGCRQGFGDVRSGASRTR